MPYVIKFHRSTICLPLFVIKFSLSVALVFTFRFGFELIIYKYTLQSDSPRFYMFELIVKKLFQCFYYSYCFIVQVGRQLFIWENYLFRFFRFP